MPLTVNRPSPPGETSDDPVESGPVEPSFPQPAKAHRLRVKPQRTLPTDRIALAKQLEILRAFGELGQTGEAVANADVASLVGLNSSTTSLANAFFNDVGLLQRTPEGRQTPSSDTIAFAQAHKWNPETAASKLASAVGRSWFGLLLLPKLRFRTYAHREILNILAEAACVPPERKSQLENLIDFMVATGVTKADNGVYSLGEDGSQTKPSTPTKADPGEERPANSAPAPSDRALPGQITFQVGLSVTMAELALLPAEKITAFFAGVAEVLKVQAELERIKGAAQ